MLENIPIKKSKLSPSDDELLFLKDCVERVKPQLILELGLGITSYIIYNSCDFKSYTAVENMQIDDKDVIRYFKRVLRYCPNIEVLHQWEYWGKFFDFIFLDSSAGYHKGGLHRREALMVAEPHLLDNSHIIIHDWCKRSGSRSKSYVLNNKRYTLIDELKSHNGIALIKYNLV